MRSLPAILLSLGLYACISEPVTTPSSAPAVPDGRQASQQLIQDIFDNIWSGTDTSYVSRYHTDEFILLEHGELWTNDTIRSYQLRKLASYDPASPRRQNSFDFFRTEQNGNEVWLAYHNYGNWIDPATGDTTLSRGWLESAVAVYTPGGWKLRMMHSTRLPH